MKRKILLPALTILWLIPLLTEAQSYTAIPDTIFEKALIELKIDEGETDGRVLTSSISSLTRLNISNKGILSLEGIEDFTNLRDLNCSFNQLTLIVLGSNDSLKNLDCSSNQLTSLDVSQNTVLEQLNCSSNELTTLDLSLNAELVQLNCSSNRLTSLNIDNNELLKSLTCSSNQISSLNVSNNTLLEQLTCSGNQISALDLSFNIYLATLFCSSNRLTTLDVSSKDSLTFVDCSVNQLSQMDITNDNTLEYLICSRNRLTNLVIPPTDSLRLLYCDNNQLGDLDISGNPLLQNLNVAYNKLALIELGPNALLNNIDLSNNLLVSLQITENYLLRTLNCSNNRLRTLDLRNGRNDILTSFNSVGNAELRCILTDSPAASAAYAGWLKDTFSSYVTECHPVTYVPDDNFEAALSEYDVIPGDNYIPTDSINSITHLDVSNRAITDLTGIQDFISLDTLNCSHNSLYNLDVSMLDSLRYLDCSTNSLSYLILKNIPEGILADMDARDNPLLECIMVDDPVIARADTTWLTDTIADYNVSCTNGRTFIPDDNFELALIELGLDRGSLDNYVVTDSISSVTSLNIKEKGISNLTGIGAFRSLDTLDCSSNLLTSLDLVQDTSLTVLYCYSNRLTSVDLSNNSHLRVLRCGNNQITLLNLSSNTALDSLVCDNNLLSGLDLSGNPNLVGLNCNSNRLTNLDLSANEGLRQVYCSGNRLTSLNVSSNTGLIDLACSNNLLTALNVSSNDTIKKIDCSVNYITSLDLTGNHYLEKLLCYSNYLKTLDVNQDTLLRELNCDNNQISNIDLSSNDSLRFVSVAANELQALSVINNRFLSTLNCSDNYITSLVLTANDSLKILNCSKNRLTALDLSHKLLLEELNCSNNKIPVLTGFEQCTLIIKLNCADNLLENLDTGSKPSLTLLNTNGNRLSELNLINNSALEDLSCSKNDLTQLDLSHNPVLKSILCSSNKLSGLNLRNMHNGLLTNMITNDNSSLTCIEVDNPADAALYPGWQKDSIASYNTNCHYFETYIPDDAFEQAIIDLGFDSGALDNYVITASIDTVTVLNIHDRNITDLTGIEGFGSLLRLNCSLNLLSELNIQENASLVSLNCSDNDLTALDLGNNMLVETLDLSGNHITSVSLDKLHSLMTLDCSSNELTELLLSGITGLTSVTAFSNNLIRLDIQNGHNQSLTLFDATGNPTLSCIEVDDPSYSSSAPGWLKDATASYSIDCHYNQTFVPDDAFEMALIALGLDSPGATTPDDYVPSSGIGTLASLNISHLDISDLTGIEDFTNLRYLECSDNILTSLNLSGNLKLERVDCSGNRLSGVDISSNILLRQLDISDNNLNILDTHNNTSLEELNCSINSLTDLNISQNSRLKVLLCYANSFYSVDLSNGNEDDLITLDIRDNKTLTCIIVSNPAAALTHAYWRKDEWATYRTECIDDDNDGVHDADDMCPFTPFGDFVDLFGCSAHILPQDNFTVSTTSETCRSSNNGKMNITAKAVFNYKASLTGDGASRDYLFTNSLEIRNLRSGEYVLLISIQEKPGYSMRYDLVITEPEDLSVLSTVNNDEKTISLKMSGGSGYTVNLNGLDIFTASPELTLYLEEGENRITVRADEECQGVFEKKVIISDDILLYPNPASEEINIYLGGYDPGMITIKLFSLSGKMVMTREYPSNEGYVTVDISQLSPGLYLLSMEYGTDRSVTNIVIE